MRGKNMKHVEDGEPYMETADVARERGVATVTVLEDVKAGLLKVAAVTVRGTRLYRRRDFQAYQQLMRERRLRREREREAAARLREDAKATTAPPKAPVERSARASGSPAA